MSETKTFNLDLPFVHLNDRRLLPKIQGIYFAVDRDKNCLYIGSTNDFRSRLTSHHRMWDFCQKSVERIYWQAVKQEHSHILRKLEDKWIEYFQPLLNVRQHIQVDMTYKRYTYFLYLLE